MPQKEPYPDKFAQPGPVNQEPVVNTEQPKEDKKLNQLDRDDLKSWWDKIAASEKLRKDELESTFKSAIDYVKGKQFAKNTPDSVVVNYIATSFWIIKNFIYANTPEYKSTGKNPIGELTAPIAELSLNYYTKESDADEENGLCILDSLMAGEGYVLDILSSDIIYGLVPKKETEFKATTDEESKGQEGDKQEKPEQFEYAEYIKKAKPLTFRISPFDIVKDTESKSYKRSRWIGRWIRKKLLSDIVDSNKYRQEAREALRKLENPERAKTVDLVELQVKRIINGEIEVWRLILCDTDHNEYLYYEKEEYQIEGFNYSLLQFKKLGDDIYGMSEFLAHKPIQDLINQVYSKINEQVSKQMIQTVINEDVLTKKGKTALKAGEGIITVKTGMNPASGAIGQAETSRVHTDLYRFEQIIRDVYRTTSGISEAMRAGIQKGGTDTLGELQLIQGGSNVTMSGFAKELKRFLLTQGRKRLQIIRQLPIQEYLPIAGYKDKIPKEFVEGAFLKFSPQYLKGEYDIDLDISTMKAQDEVQERAEIKDMIVTLAEVDPLLRQEGKRIKISKLVEDWIRTKKRFNTDEYIEDLQLRTADEENLGFIMMGQTGNIIPVRPQEGENYQEHAQKHQEFMAGPLKSLIPTVVWMKVAEPHLAETLARIQQHQDMMRNATK